MCTFLFTIITVSISEESYVYNLLYPFTKGIVLLYLKELDPDLSGD